MYTTDYHVLRNCTLTTTKNHLNKVPIHAIATFKSIIVDGKVYK